MKKSIPVEFIPLIDWWEKEGKSTVLWAAVLLVLAGGYFAYAHLRTSRKAAASEALLSAATAEELQEAADAYGSSAAGPALRMRLASALYNKGEFAQALAAYEELAGNPPEGFADVPVVGRAQCLEALGRTDEACAAYKAFAEAKPKSFLALTARLGVARCLAAKGDKAQALALLDALDKEFAADAAAQAQIADARDLVKRPVRAFGAQKDAAVSEALKDLAPAKK